MPRPLLIVSRAAQGWQDRLQELFAGRSGVAVMVDRRQGERRRRALVTAVERRRRPRRRRDIGQDLDQRGFVFVAPEHWPTTRDDKRILLVEDDPLVADALAQLLRCDGYQVDVVDNGVRALAELAARDYNVIVCDVSLPELDGPGVYRGVSLIAPHLLPRFIFITGHDVAEGEEDLAQVTAPLLHKPFEINQLQQAIRRVS
jgi:CheY-like chemotaxis protein